MGCHRLSAVLALSAVSFALSFPVHAQYQMERLSRGTIAVRTSGTQVYVGWRLLGTDPGSTSFNVYRSSGGGTPTLLNGSPITGATQFVDNSATASQANTYSVRAVVNGVEQAAVGSFTLPANAPTRQYLEIPLQVPPGGTTPSGENYTYNANDLSVGDLDGDGEFEYVLKWEPSNAKDNSQSGYTGNVFLDAYELNGTRMWRIDLGRNIRAGAHYTQFMVYDLDGDGRAEVAAKTADGTRSGTGQVIGNANADHRNTSGYIITGPEFLTIFNGQTGAVLATTNYLPARGNVSDWGDNYGNRVDRFLAGIAYLDGQRPSLIMARGYYTRSHVVAWDWRNGQLTQRWAFNAANGTSYAGQGNHNLSIADVDNDGRHEIVYGAMVVDDNGAGKHTTGFGHGDALHVSDLDPNRSGIEIFNIHEPTGGTGASLRNGNSGQAYFTKQTASGQEGPGRGMAADIDPRHRGAEYWVAGGGISGLFNNAGTVISSTVPPSCNFAVWWDADPLRELLDSNVIDKWNFNSSNSTRLLTASGATSNNGSKSTPALSGDLFGDWREEVIWRTTDNRFLRIYTTTVPATNRFYTFLHDPQYRVALAWQNVAYNQPPHPGFFVGDGMGQQPTPNIVVPGGGNPNPNPNPNPGVSTYEAESMPLGGGSFVESTNGGYIGSGYINFPASGGTLDFQNVDGRGGGSRTLRIRYALGATANRAGTLLVNGTSQNVTFTPTGAWTTWGTLTLTVNLNGGTSNTLRFQSTGQDLGNIDQIEIQ
jgi:rhamnogalacturonan endolyase